MVKIITKKEQAKLDELDFLLKLYDIDLEGLKQIILERHIIQDETEKMRKLVSKLLKKHNELEKRFDSINSSVKSKENSVKEKEKLKTELNEFLNTQQEVNI